MRAALEANPKERANRVRIVTFHWRHEAYDYSIQGILLLHIREVCEPILQELWCRLDEMKIVRGRPGRAASIKGE
jgi:hypothetical protein